MQDHFDLVVIGGGSGGVAAARRAAAHGARVALIEQAQLGGTCVHRGCIPKKLLMYAGQLRNAFDLASAFGWAAGKPHFSMMHWQNAKAVELQRLESVYSDMLRKAGVEVTLGQGTVSGKGAVIVGERQLRYTHLLIATGGRPATVPIPGLDTALTSDELLELRVLPKRLAVIGSGYIGMEFASMFARLGSEVSVFFRAPQPLTGFDHDLRVRLHRALEDTDIHLFAQAEAQSITRNDEGYQISLADGRQASFDVVLNATGRMPNAAHLGLESIGMPLLDSGAIAVDSYSRTPIPSVYAIGDVTNRLNLTPVAIAEGRAFADTLFGGLDISFDHRQVATAVFTDPPIGSVGLTEECAAARGLTTIYETEFKPMLTAFAGRDTRAYMKLVVDTESDKVVGIHMIGPDAPEIIQSLAVAVRAGANKRDFDRTAAVHPTAAEEFVLMREPTRRHYRSR